MAEVYHEDGNNGKTYARLRNFAAPTSAPPGAGVPGGLPSAAPIQAAAPVAPQAVQPAVDAGSPWATAPAPAVQQPAAPQFNNTVPLPPSFG